MRRGSSFTDQHAVRLLSMVPRRLLRATALVMLFASPPLAQAQTYNVLYSFQCGPNDGKDPTSGVVRDLTGNLYGITNVGGTYSLGTVYKLAIDGTEKILYSFAGPPADGSEPAAVPILDAQGNLYGTTELGGRYSYGTAYKLTSSGTETILHNFGWQLSDGRYPNAVTRDATGHIFGTAVQGGDTKHSYGTAFEIFPGGQEFTLHSFGLSGDGINPYAPLIEHAGEFYGTTQAGGAHGAGTIFELTRSGAETTLYSFGGGPDGGQPDGKLLREPAGDLLGTTAYGGTSKHGTVFRLSATGIHKVLYSFAGAPDGENPVNGLSRDSAGNLYGVTLFGGTGPCNDGFGDIGCGVIFKVSATEQESVLYSFNGTPDGQYPTADLIWDKSGNLYGTTEQGGTCGCGTVFKFTP